MNLNVYETAAREMCGLLGENPDAVHDDAPRWMLYAYRMAEYQAMVECLNRVGPFGFIVSE